MKPPLLFEDKLLVNSGSVGQPRGEEQRAGHAVLDTEELTVECKRTEHEIDSVISRVEEAGLPIKIETRLLDGS